MYLIDSRIGKHSGFFHDGENIEINSEPMFFSSDLEFAYKNGGDITKSFIDNLPDHFKTEDSVFDSRVHMLMKDWWPCIPGFHHDDVPRHDGGQPNYDNPEYFSKHALGIVGAEISPTEFAIGSSVFEKVTDGVVYEKWNRDVLNKVKLGDLWLMKAEDRTIYLFDAHTWHRGSKAIDDGWRWFGRVSTNTDRTKNIKNIIRTQVQVYLDNPYAGW